MNSETPNPYATPRAQLETEPSQPGDLEYVGFWPRVGASILDSILIVMVSIPVLYWIYGDDYFLADTFIHGPADFVLSYVFPAIAIVLFWAYRSATPGKMAIRAKIVDERTGGKPSTGQLIVRYLGYYPATIALGLGILWVAWDTKKQGWHDKMARTVVVRPRKAQSAEVRFDAN